MTDRTTPQDPPNSLEDQPSSQGISRRQFLGTGAAAVTLLSSLPVEASSPAVGAGSVFRIHPAIGIARMGNASPDSFFIGPEVPGFGPASLGSPAAYKSNGQVKPQAARFRIWEYRNDPATGHLVPFGEVTLGTQNVTSIRWTAHLANKKASFHVFYGPAGESSPYVSADAATTPGPLRNASVADRASLEIDFGARSISGASQPPVSFAPDAAHQVFPRKPSGDPVIDYLGQLRTDSSGRLIVIGGAGKAGYIGDAPTPLASYANNDGWFDDASDGPVTATITYVDSTGTHDVQAEGAWVLCTPPDFAPRVRPVVTLYDLLTDMAVRFLPVPANALYDDGGPLHKISALKAAYIPDPNNEFPGYVASFADDVFPVLRAAYDMWWVTALVNRKHTSLIDPNLGNPDPSYDTDRQGVFIYVRPPLTVNSNITGPMTMPHLLGDDPYSGKEPDSGRKMTVTHVQYGMLRNWAAGGFTPPLTKVGPPSPQPPPPGPGLITPDGLDRAAIENAAGGGFYPGIEVGWQIRNPNLFKEPFRLDLNATSQYIGESAPIGPGHFSRQGAVPWHADFNDCRHEGDYGWWPSQRPDDALPSYGAQQRLSWARPNNASSNQQQNTTHEDMVANWWKYGFIVEVPDPAGVNAPQLVETERNAAIP